MSLPEGWAWATLGEIAEIKSGVTLGKKYGPLANLIELPYLRVANVQRGRLALDEIKSIHITREEAAKLFLLPGDILMNEGGDRDKLGRGWVWGGKIESCIHQNHVFRARLSDNTISPYYVSHYTNLFGQSFFIEHGTQTTNLASVSKQKLSSFPVPLPPAAEQRRILEKLDALTARLALARAHLERSPELTERFELSILRAAVTGKLSEHWRSLSGGGEPVEDLLRRIAAPSQGRGGRNATDKLIAGAAALAVGDPKTTLPAGWRWVDLLRVAKQETGHTPSRSQPSYWDGGVPWIGIRDAGAHHGRSIEETAQTISEAGLANSSARMLPAGTVCLSRTASVGYVTIMARSMATSQDFATWTCTEALLPEYLMYALMAEGDDIRKFGMGSTHTTIYFPEIRALHIALPPIEEQREIVASIKSALARAHCLETEASRARALLHRLETAILAKAFRGELVPQDPGDEPASVLLERIRAERAAAPKSRRGRKAAA